MCNLFKSMEIVEIGKELVTIFGLKFHYEKTLITYVNTRNGRIQVSPAVIRER